MYTVTELSTIFIVLEMALWHTTTDASPLDTAQDYFLDTLRRKVRREIEDNYYDEVPGPPPTLSSSINICDLKGSYPIYCYCNTIELGEVSDRPQRRWVLCTYK